MEVYSKMKISKLRKWLVLFALVLFIQNGAVIIQNTSDAAEIGSEESIAPCSDCPDQDAPYN